MNALTTTEVANRDVLIQSGVICVNVILENYTKIEKTVYVSKHISSFMGEKSPFLLSKSI